MAATKKDPRGPFADKLWREALRKAALEMAEGKRGPKKLEMAARKVVDAAVAGDMQAARELGDRLDGRAAQTIEATISDARMVVRGDEKSADVNEWAGKHGPH